MQRASHAVVAGGGTWLIDPVDGDDLDQILAPLPPVRGVLQLIDRHGRDGAALAGRFGVPCHRTPAGGVPGLPLTAVPVVMRPWWREVALWWPETGSLIVAESLGTAPYFPVPGARIGIHPMMRLTPPRRLADLEAGRLLCCHGAPATGPGVADEIRRALDDSRRDAPRMLARLVRHRGRPPV